MPRKLGVVKPALQNVPKRASFAKSQKVISKKTEFCENGRSDSTPEEDEILRKTRSFWKTYMIVACGFRKTRFFWNETVSVLQNSVLLEMAVPLHSVT